MRLMSSPGGNRYTAPKARKPLKSRPMYKALLWGLGIVSGLVLLAGLSVGLLFAYRWTTNSTYFELKEVTVSGNNRLSYEEVVSTAGLRAGQNCLAVKVPAVESALLANPWVEQVAVKRVLPAKFEINVVERQPCYWVVYENKVYYADRTGAPIGPVETQGFLPLPLLKLEPGAERVLPVLADLIGLAEHMRMPFDLNKASWIKVGASCGLEVYYDDQKRSFSLGVDNLEGNIDRMNMAWNDLRRRGEAKDVRSIKSHNGNVWVVTADVRK